MTNFHFVGGYRRMVKSLLKRHSLDEAMSLAVGGEYEKVGEVEKNILVFAGLRDGMSIVDLGCGSGRLASALGRSCNIAYLGTDVVPSLIEYARKRSPKDFRFVLHHALSLPSPDSSLDIVCAFSVFTHLFHEETYLYLEDCLRALKPGGCLVFSFLEFSEPTHWRFFRDMLEKQQRKQRRQMPAVVQSLLHKFMPRPLDMFIERNVIALWAGRLGFVCERIVGATEAPWGGLPLGQSVAILRKP
jgi:ubiquinone/menaquinone biosynthesis C-methylase UbiE